MLAGALSATGDSVACALRHVGMEDFVEIRLWGEEQAYGELQRQGFGGHRKDAQESAARARRAILRTDDGCPTRCAASEQRHNHGTCRAPQDRWTASGAVLRKQGSYVESNAS